MNGDGRLDIIAARAYKSMYNPFAKGKGSLVWLEQPVDPSDQVVAGSHLIAVGDPANAAHDQGYVTSAAYSPTLGTSIGIGFLKNGAARKGDVVRAMNPIEGSEVMVQIVSTHFFDPEGVRLRA